MANCDRFRPLLYRYAEGEVTPGEAMLIARHVSGCTGCKILLARERRLATMLEEQLRDEPVGEEFLQGVMAQLPEQTELPVRRKRKNRRGLKLAGLFGFLAPAAWAATQEFTLTGNAPVLGLPEAHPETVEGTVRGAMSLVQWVVMALETAVSSAPLWLTSAPRGLALAGGLVLVAGATVLLASTACALAAGCAIRWNRLPRITRVRGSSTAS